MDLRISMVEGLAPTSAPLTEATLTTRSISRITSEKSTGLTDSSSMGSPLARPKNRIVSKVGASTSDGENQSAIAYILTITPSS